MMTNEMQVQKLQFGEGLLLFLCLLLPRPHLIMLGQPTVKTGVDAMSDSRYGDGLGARYHEIR